jgi:hypothetical protein
MGCWHDYAWCWVDPHQNMVCMVVRNVRYDFEEFVDENANVGEMTMILHLLAKESGLDRTRLGGM